jgi:hypothetical protein
MIMKSRSCRLTVEALEDRSVPSTVAYGDFNNDGLVDKAALTSPTTITVSLAKPDGSYSVSAILTAPKNQPIQDIYQLIDRDGDGDLDIYAAGYKPSGSMYTVPWQNNGDATFDFIEPVKVDPHFKRWI